MIQPLFVFSDWGILVLRVILGAVLVIHGWPKIKNLQTTAGEFGAMGFRPGIFWGGMVALLEFIGGIFLVFGLFTQIISILIVIQFLVIIFKLKFTLGFKAYEIDILILGMALLLSLIGGGVYGLDNFLSIWIY